MKSHYLIGLIVVIFLYSCDLNSKVDKISKETLEFSEPEQVQVNPEPVSKPPSSKTEIELTCMDFDGPLSWRRNECEIWYSSFEDGGDGEWKEPFIKHLRNNQYNKYGYQYYVMGKRESKDDYGNKKVWREKLYITPTIKVSKPFYDELQKFPSDNIQGTVKGEKLWFPLNFFVEITFESDGKDGLEELVLPDDY